MRLPLPLRRNRCGGESGFHGLRDLAGSGRGPEALLPIAGGGGKTAAFNPRILPRLAEDIRWRTHRSSCTRRCCEDPKSPFGLQIEQLSLFLFVKEGNPSDLFRQQQDAAVGIQNFRPPVGTFDVLAKADGPMVGEDDDVCLVNKGQNRIRKGLSARRFILGDRHVAEKDFDFGRIQLGNRFSCNREGGGVRRMTMNDALDVRALFIDFQMQKGLAASFLGSRQLFSGHVDQRDILRLQEAFAVHRRRTKDFVLTDSNRNVSVVGGGKAFIIEPSANLADILFDFVGVHV